MGRRTRVSEATMSRSSQGNNSTFRVDEEMPPSPTLPSMTNGIVRCTVCRNQINVNFLSHFDKHPKLGVIICKRRCSKFLSLGDWTKDENGAEEHCTWCGQGGDVFVCDTCQVCAFCKDCLRRNFGRKYVDAVSSQTWACFVCDPKPLKTMQEQFQEIMENLEKRKNQQRSRITSVGSSQRKARPSTVLDNGQQTKSRPIKQRSPIPQLSESPAASDNSQTNSRPIQRYSPISQLSESPAATGGEKQIKILTSLLRRAVWLTADYHDFIKRLQDDLTAALECSDTGDDGKVATANGILSTFRETMVEMNSFAGNMETSLNGRICIQVGPTKYAWLDEEHRSNQPSGSNETPENDNEENENSAVSERHPEKRSGPHTTSPPRKKSRVFNDESTTSTSNIPDEQGTREDGTVFMDAYGSPRQLTSNLLEEHEDGSSRISIPSGFAHGMDQEPPPSSPVSIVADSTAAVDETDEKLSEIGCAEVMEEVPILDQVVVSMPVESNVDAVAVEEASPAENECTEDQTPVNSDDPRTQLMSRIALDSDSDSDEDQEINNLSDNKSDSNGSKSDLSEDSDGDDGRRGDTNSKKPKNSAVKTDETAPNEQERVSKAKKRNIHENEEGFDPVLEAELASINRSLRWDPFGKKNSTKENKGDRKQKQKPKKSQEESKQNEERANEAEQGESLSEDGECEDDMEMDEIPGEEEEEQIWPINPPLKDLIIPLDRIDVVEGKTDETSSAKNGLMAMIADDSDSSEDDSSEEEPAEERPATKRKPPAKPPIQENQDDLVQLSSDTDDGDDIEAPVKSKDERRRDRLLRMRISIGGEGTSTSSKKDKNHSSARKRKMLKRRRVLSSDDDDDDGSSTPTSCYATDNSDESDSSSGEDNEIGEKKKNTRSKLMAEVKQEPTLSQNSQMSTTPGSPSKGAMRRNIRPVMKASSSTLEAQAAERERIKRTISRFESSQNSERSTWIVADTAPIEEIVLSVSASPALILDEDAEPPVQVHPSLASQLKPHQIEGVKYLYTTTIESVAQKDNPLGGCILAHCMGLGKTLQVIAFLHSVLDHPQLGLKTALVVAPLNVVLNWKAEFAQWLNNCNPLQIFELSNIKQIKTRCNELEKWQRDGGVLILGYTMFKQLADGVRIKDDKIKQQLASYLLDPGPDVVVCDEGHILKNEKTGINICMNRIKTKRRICLTGTPLQNNLMEYYCMVQFVKPNLLGTVWEFRNQFVNPIRNGQCQDSQPIDVRLMKKRAHVLHSMLEGSIHRMDYSVLKSVLPPRHEFVLMVRLSDKQVELYNAYLENVVGDLDITALKARKRLFSDFNALQRVCMHPLALQVHMEKYCKDTTESEDTNDCNVTASENEEINATGDRKASVEEESANVSGKITPSRVSTPVDDPGWWKPFVTDQDFERFELSGKLILLMEILWKCELVGEKVLVFSQSLICLDAIEQFLASYPKFIEMFHSTTEEDKARAVKRKSLRWGWEIGRDYVRMDGTINAVTRKRYINRFNDEKRPRCRLFLVSTKAGGVGTNLVGANRVVIFDVMWNPSNDSQAIFRAYRYGQEKEVYIYRFVSQGTMEEVIYHRQITKQSLALRVVDEKQIERHFYSSDLEDLYQLRSSDTVPKVPTAAVPKDNVLADLLLDQKNWVVTYHEHDSLLQNMDEENLTEEEKQLAWKEYDDERQGRRHDPRIDPLMQCVLTQPELHDVINRGNRFLQESEQKISMETLCNSKLSENPTWVSEPSKLLEFANGIVGKFADIAKQRQQQAAESQSRREVPPQNLIARENYAIQQPSTSIAGAPYGQGFVFAGLQPWAINNRLQSGYTQFPGYTSHGYTRMDAPAPNWQPPALVNPTNIAAQQQLPQ